MRCCLPLLVVAFSLTTLLAAQNPCAQDHRSDKKRGLILTDVSIVGPTTLTSDQLAEIANQMAGSCYDEDSDELGERIRMSFQDQGYFRAEVKGVHLKDGDPLGIPKPVSMEVELQEGLRYKLGEIGFAKNRAFTSERLRQEFPIKSGDWFERAKVAAGIEALRKLYGSDGFLDYTAIPETEPASNGTIRLTMSFEEGPQYRLEKVEFVAKQDAAAKLQAQWKLDAGSVYDSTYVEQFIEANHDLLPQEFGREKVQTARDCPAALVQVRFVIDAAEESSKSAMKDVPCEEKKVKQKE